MAKQKFDYYEIINASNLPTLEFKHIAEFIRMAESKDVQAMFISHSVVKSDGENMEVDYFMILLNNVFYIIKTNGYKAAYDYLEGIDKGFHNAADYYEAMKLGFHDFKEFEECKKSGVQDRAQYGKMLKLGFAEHFEEFKTAAAKAPKMLPENFDLSSFDTAIKLYLYASERGFKDFGDFSKATLVGFPDQLSWEQGRNKGFTHYYEFKNATRMGFDSPREYQEAMHAKINSKHEYNVYTYYKKLAKNIYSFDEANLMDALMIYENNKKLPIKKLKELLVEIEEKVKFAPAEGGGKCVPVWYTKKLIADNDIIQFLSKCTELANYGVFDAEAEFFEVSRLSNTKIYIDASNVAYGNQNRSNNPKPLYRNIISMADELRRRRYGEIIVIADASLKHKIGDERMLEPLKKLVTYLEAPGKTSADEYLIEKAKDDKCYIITNDTFSDWREKDEWIAKNVDKIRVPFILDENNKVSIPALDRLAQEK